MCPPAHRLIRFYQGPAVNPEFFQGRFEFLRLHVQLPAQIFTGGFFVRKSGMNALEDLFAGITLFMKK